MCGMIHMLFYTDFTESVGIYMFPPEQTLKQKRSTYKNIKWEVPYINPCQAE